MRRKRHEPIRQESLDEPFCPPPEEYLYRCLVCSEEILVNEAIIDRAMSMAKFHGEYTGRIPTLGCPGCNGETHEGAEPSQTASLELLLREAYCLTPERRMRMLATFVGKP